jgi:hypothetical protein
MHTGTSPGRFCLFLVLALTLTTGCADTTNEPPSINLIFVVSPDLAYPGPGDVDPATANLTNQGLQRSLRLATYLKERVLAGNNVNVIATLEPMTHPQTVNDYPDMTGIAYIQQFALLNRLTLQGTTAYSYFLAATYGPGSEPAGAYTPTSHVAATQGLDFNDVGGNNLALADRIINAGNGGYFVFCAPWDTIRNLMTAINNSRGYNLNIPAVYGGPNKVYAMSINPSAGSVSFNTYDSGLNPPATYPVLPAPVPYTGVCTQQAGSPFTITRSAGDAGVVVPANINLNSTVYLIRHAEAHPGNPNWDDGNYVGTGQWRALALPDALNGVINPDMVYSIDPSQAFIVNNVDIFSYVRPSLTVWPYVVANSLPYKVVAHFYLSSADDQTAADNTVDFFFTGGTFSNKTVLVAWEHAHFPLLITTLLNRYGGAAPPVLTWPDGDYDTIWRVQLDGAGNVTIDNSLCEGIDSSALPAEPPRF